MGVKIFRNAKIIVSFDPVKIADIMVTDNGKVVDIGTEEELKGRLPKGHEAIDLNGDIVMPGFIDAHMHLDNFGEYLNEIDLVGVSSINELQTKISGSHGMMGWVIGHGWDEHRFTEHRMPTRSDIEEVESERPVYLSRVDLHSAVLNSKAIDLLELKDRFHKSENLVEEGGQLTGVVRENVFEYVDRTIKEKCTEDESCTMLTDAIEEAAKNGLTSVGFVSCSLSALRFLERLRDEGNLKIRVRAYINADELDSLKEFRNDDMLKVAGVKMFADGSLGTKTALLSFSYKDDPGNRGVEISSQAKMLETALKAEKKGLQVATHAIGDKALDNVIEVYRKLKGKHRIDHVSLIRDDQMDELATMEHMLVVQPHFVITDFWTIDRIGRERAGIAYPFRKMIEGGFELALSTDCPVEPINPWETIYAAITRGKSDGIPLGQITDSERLSTDEAMDLYTKGSAKAIGEPALGSLRKGNYADFIVIDRDPFASDYPEIRNTKVLSTYVGGEKVH